MRLDAPLVEVFRLLFDGLSLPTFLKAVCSESMLSHQMKMPFETEALLKVTFLPWRVSILSCRFTYIAATETNPVLLFTAF